MKNVKELPEGYSEILSVDLQKNKRLAVFVNALAIVIAVLMIVPAVIFVYPDIGLSELFIQALVTFAGVFVYIILHELTHGVFMRLFGCRKPKFGFTGLYAYARADCYFAKLPYIVIALAPVVIWGLILLVLNIALPLSWFYPVYIIQVMNISGAAGDIYVTARFIFMPNDILVFDTGAAMTVYSKEK